MNAKGRGFLIAGGVLYIIVGVMGFFGAIAVNAIPEIMFVLLTGVPQGMVVFYFGAVATVYVLFGIAGIVSSNKPEQGYSLFLSVIILLIINTVFSHVILGSIAQHLGTALFDFVLRVGFAAIFGVGAWLNMDQWKNGPPVGSSSSQNSASQASTHTTHTFAPNASAPPVNAADELTKYADLLERGLIRREEFDDMKDRLIKPVTENKPLPKSPEAP